jgi:serine/threonine protein kinase
MSTVNFGRYEIRRELGRGAMGVVYEADDPVRGVDVALKVMTVNPSASPDSRKRQLDRFLREAHALARLSHPNVVAVFDEGEVDGRQFFSMELVRGTNLRDRLSFQGPLSVPELIRLALDIGAALDHIHTRGVVHRDVKPDNIMLLPDGSAKLMDFGIVQLQDEAGSAPSGGFQGSPAYMSPEQVSGLGVDGRTDLYSLAVTLYEAATGRRAVEGDSIPVITSRVLQEFPPPPVGLPPFLQGILMRALQKNPADRYQSARTMMEDIRAGRMPQAPAPPPPPRPQQQERTYFGTPPSGYPAVSPGGPAVTEFLLPGHLPTDPGAPPAQFPQGASRPACRMHPGVAGVALCTNCGHPMCYTCSLEVPGRGVICRTCAFGRR